MVAVKAVLAVVIDVPQKIRLERVKQRTIEKFGDRVLPDGDLYEKEKEFLDRVATKSDDIVEKWIDTLNCPIMRVDGTKPVWFNVGLIERKLLDEDK